MERKEFKKSREQVLLDNPEADMIEEERVACFGERTFRYVHEVSK